MLKGNWTKKWRSKCEIFWSSEGALSFSTKIQVPFPVLPDIIPQKCAPFTEVLGALMLDQAIKSDTIFFFWSSLLS